MKAKIIVRGKNAKKAYDELRAAWLKITVKHGCHGSMEIDCRGKEKLEG